MRPLIHLLHLISGWHFRWTMNRLNTKLARSGEVIVTDITLPELREFLSLDIEAHDGSRELTDGQKFTALIVFLLAICSLMYLMLYLSPPLW